MINVVPMPQRLTGADGLRFKLHDVLKSLKQNTIKKIGLKLMPPRLKDILINWKIF